MAGRWRALTVGVAVVALLAGCGGGDDGGRKVAGLQGASASSTGTDEDKVREYKKCMRERGFDLDAKLPADAADPERDRKSDEADKACEPLLPNGGQPTPPDAKEMDEGRQKAKCIREHGYDMPDPLPGKRFGFNAEQWNDERFQKAFMACGASPQPGPTR
ncbi:hypothetical protein [Actinocrispum wychmicini]|uniref:hypothetical protein n=1 Tax=Actinocrispum wychmicini TaxID=1213861 RepID=UPI00104FDAB6|nr:hypothetical protein [Actinocrispum wychmicini]